jgi:hypothetical protein
VRLVSSRIFTILKLQRQRKPAVFFNRYGSLTDIPTIIESLIFAGKIWYLFLLSFNSGKRDRRHWKTRFLCDHIWDINGFHKLKIISIYL